MDSSISILRLFAVLATFLALIVSLFARQVAASSAQGAADAAAVAVTDAIPADWDCTEAGLPPDAEAVAAGAAAERLLQLAAVQPVGLEVRAGGACSVIVTVRAASRGWLGGTGALGIACRRPPSGAASSPRAPIAPAC